MCGIFGVSNIQKNELEKAHSSLHTLTHRGPDGWGYTLENKVYLGHRRLSILDLSENGKQPMEYGGVYLTVNGEIYGFAKLRSELEHKYDVKFKSTTDSEVLLHGYIHWGIDKLLERIDGIFALTIYDSNIDKIFIARDHAGVKPLYYSLINNDLAWASELKALEEFHGKENLAIDYTAIYDFLSYFCIPSPKSLYQNIYKLEAGYYATFDTKTHKLEKTKYWDIPINRSITDIEKAKKLIQISIQDAVREQMVADVPLGAFLSGGTDSSIVCFEATKLTKNLTTCSISFDDDNVDESKYSNKVAKLIYSNHVIDAMNHNLVNENFKLLKDLFDEPFADTSAFPTYMVSELAKKHMTVVLTGDGGDELFGGYNNYNQWFQKLTHKLGFLFPLRPFVSWLKNNTGGVIHQLARKIEIFTILCPMERQIRLRGGLIHTDKYKKQFRKKYNIPENYDDTWYLKQFYREDLSPISRAMYLDFKTGMTDSILTKVDRTSMAVAVEARTPLLSKKVIETAWKISEDILFIDDELKGILKSTYKNDLPADCLYRKKQGFSLGKALKGDKLYRNNKLLPITILETLYPEVLK